MNMDLVFTFIAAAVLLAAVTIFFTKNPVYSILSLFLTYVLASTTLFLLGLSYFGFIMLIIYGGAIVILFIYVVMTIAFKIEEYKAPRRLFSTVCVLLSIGTLFFLNFFFSINVPVTDPFRNLAADRLQNSIYPVRYTPLYNNEFGKWNDMDFIGYDYFFAEEFFNKQQLLFILLGFLLLIAIMGTALIVYNLRLFREKQDPSEQISRKPEDAVAIVVIKN